ncbi:MAG: FAD-binding protein [Micromonosporaceae bacterium]|nr:FAD-binding protein [Micromonosporaceae bacterium]
MTVHTALAGACQAWPAGPDDAVASVLPTHVATPTTVDEVAAVLRVAAGHGLAVVPRGTGGRLAWGAPPERCDLLLDLSGLDAVIDHAAGDMVVQVQAGVQLDRLAGLVAGAGQQLALDPPGYHDGPGTVGGALAVGLAGPRRLRYGRPRDLLLGLRMVRADGVVASAGGRVVKNVAGYDLGKLLTGSYGTLGVIVAATLRLHPLPAATAWVTVTAPDPSAGYAQAQAILDSQLAASAVEIDRPGAGAPVAVAALFEGTGSGVAARAAAAAELVGGVAGGSAPEWFGRCPGTPAGTLVELSFPPARLSEVLGLVDSAAESAGLPVPVRGSAGPAVLHAALPAGAEPEPAARFLAALRGGLGRDGAAVVRHAPPPVRAVIDLWGPVDAGALALMRRVKDQFDPDRRLAPGRFVGGI